MAFEIVVRGQKLTQQQLDAITPVLNESMTKRMSPKRFEDECLKAMAKSGCPLDTEAEPPAEEKTKPITPKKSKSPGFCP